MDATKKSIFKLLLSVPGGRFPIEQRRVRFAVFLRLLQKLRQPHPAPLMSQKTLLATLRLCSQTPFYVTAFANPPGVAALHSK